MKILCPTDFSDRARAAARVAVSLAARTAGSVELLHVVPLRTADRVAQAADAAALEDTIRSSGQARLAGEARELATGGVQVTSFLAEGDVESSILARAEQIASDVVVMGSHARSALERFVLGSTAERTLRRADRPVIIVPPGVDRLGHGPDGKARLRVVVALDGRTASAGGVDFVRTLRRHVACDVTFLRLYWAIEEFTRLGLTGPRELFAPDTEVIADLSRQLALEVGVLPGSGQMSFAIEPAWGDPATCLLQIASKQNTDLVIMGAESRRGLARIAHPPIAERVARYAFGAPVVFVPEPTVPAAAGKAPGIFTVLAPTDLSAAGNRAVPFAYAMLASHGGVVELCYVNERSLPSPAYVYDRPEGKLSDVERGLIERELRGLIPPEFEHSRITTHVTVIDGGRAGQAIVQAAERLAADAIVLGSHGRGSAHRALLGSVSQDVVRHARRPVLVVPDTTKEAS
jgi:nucleotide-binding universal stress UspA family protein